MGQVASLGVIFYSVGKVINGVIGDMVGGKKIFLLGMLGSVFATIVFSMGQGPGFFFIAWAANRAIQSMGWGGLVKVTAHWVSYRSYAKVMALLSLSFLFGDIVAKLLLGELKNWGLSWQQLFWVSAAILGTIALASLFFVKESPQRVRLEAPPVNPHNLFTEAGEESRATNLRELLGPYFRNLSFVLMLILSFGLTAIREAFNFWIPTYLFETTRLSIAAAAQYSSLYSLFGILSILLAGWLSDSVLKGRRGLIIAIACLPMAVVLWLMTGSVAGQVLPLILISLIGLLLLGPYSFLAGAMSLDAGGRKGAATASGLVDAIGYVGGTFAVWLTGRLAQQYNWNSAFVALAIIAALTALAASVFYWTQERNKKAASTDNKLKFK